MKFVCALAALALASTPALADDSSAALAAGGLVFTKQADIRMAIEDLHLSPKEARVRYEFVNDGKKDVETVVAFPMPDIDVRQFWYEPLGTTLEQSPNFMGFALTVDGKKVAATPDERAVLDGKDVTAQVKAAGLPINIAGSKLIEKIDHLSPAQKKSLAAAGLIEMDSGEAHPHWIAKTSYWWHQVFPAGKTVVIEHRYQPVTGQFFFGLGELIDKDTHYIRDFCLDAPTQAAIRARVKKLDPTGTNGQYLQGYQTEFVLRTANNWKGPIGHFKLTLDKLKPDNLLSLCWGAELKKTGPTTFESTTDNLAPAHDISLLVLQ
jgi:hypothetical protein